MITAKQVKELRDLTGAGMLDCKKALEETNGDIEQAVIYLREKGIAKAAKKGARIAAEGLTNGIVEGNKAVLYEVNSETDFVSKNEQFLNLIDTVGTVLFNNTVNSDEEALKLESNGESLETVLANATATIGEKITLRRVKTIIKEDNQTFGFYKHMGGKISALALVEGDEEVAKNIAMHVAAQNPKYLTQDEIEQSVIEQERSILLNQALEENKTAEKPKPENIIEKMVEGRLNKELKEVCLVNQAYVKDPNISVSEYLKQNKASVKLFVRLEVGEGIEKRKEDFAAEVQAQIKG
ncbi:MAG: translation elongation factor Ts [Acholeplasmataceae bacterium]|jgi:elongation factor Ts|nr:translation elongation factor Ts [Acholeplasmatales bacterium]